MQYQQEQLFSMIIVRYQYQYGLHIREADPIQCNDWSLLTQQ